MTDQTPAWSFETKQIHAGAAPDPATGARASEAPANNRRGTLPLSSGQPWQSERSTLVTAPTSARAGPGTSGKPRPASLLWYRGRAGELDRSAVRRRAMCRTALLAIGGESLIGPSDGPTVAELRVYAAWSAALTFVLIGCSLRWFAGPRLRRAWWAGALVGAAAVAVGTLAPEFVLPDLDGHPHGLASLRASGQPVLLLFSSPHCVACQALAPKLPGLASSGIHGIEAWERPSARDATPHSAKVPTSSSTWTRMGRCCRGRSRLSSPLWRGAKLISRWRSQQ